MLFLFTLETSLLFLLPYIFKLLFFLFVFIFYVFFFLFFSVFSFNFPFFYYSFLSRLFPCRLCLFKFYLLFFILLFFQALGVGWIGKLLFFFQPAFSFLFGCHELLIVLILQDAVFGLLGNIKLFDALRDKLFSVFLRLLF